MYFTSEEWLAFARKLEEATSSGKLQWTGSDDSFDDGYSAVIPGNAIYRLRSRDNDDQFPFVLQISDPSGDEIAEFTTVPFNDAWDQDFEQQATSVLASLYERVSRLVTGAPQKAKSLLDGLDNLITDVNDTPF